MEKKKAHFLKFARVSSPFFERAKKLLEVLKIDYVQAPNEAAAQLNYMYSMHFIDFVARNDGEYILQGTPLLDTHCKSGTCKLRMFNPPTRDDASEYDDVLDIGSESSDDDELEDDDEDNDSDNEEIR